MITITTKQLRENMPKVIRDLRQGKIINLSYRHRVIGILQPIESHYSPLRRGSLDAVSRGLSGLLDVTVPKIVSQDNRSLKEQISEVRRRKYD